MKSKVNCQNCKVVHNVRGLRFHMGKYLCHNCFQKVANLIPSISLEEPNTEQLSIHFAVPASLDKRLNDRIKFLYGKVNRNKSNYIRLLILSDLEAK